MQNLQIKLQNEGNKTIFKKDIAKDSELYKLLKKVEPYFAEYQSRLDLKNDCYYSEVIAIKNDNGDGTPHPMHIDQSVSETENNVSVASFVTLLYLSESGDAFQAGQLYFPFQNKVIEPRIGRMLLFPSGQLYPHKILPFFGEPRYLLRIFHHILNFLIELS